MTWTAAAVESICSFCALVGRLLTMPILLKWRNPSFQPCPRRVDVVDDEHT